MERVSTFKAPSALKRWVSRAKVDGLTARPKPFPLRRQEFREEPGMTRFVFLWALACLLAVNAEARVWTDATGSVQVEAEYINVKDGIVRLRKPDGKIATVPLNKLSLPDQEFVHKQVSQPDSNRPATDSGWGTSTPRLDESIRNNPNDAKAYYRRGLARLHNRMLPEAIADLQKAIDLDPEMAVAYDARGSVYREMGNFAKAHQDFSLAIQRDPELASAYRHRGENLPAFSRTPEGKLELSEARERFRKKYHTGLGVRRDAPCQDACSTPGNVSWAPIVLQLAKVDFDRARELESRQAGRCDARPKKTRLSDSTRGQTALGSP
jgi:hypothetical protein